MPPRCCGDESAARGVRSLAAAGAAALHGRAAPRRVLPRAASTTAFFAQAQKRAGLCFPSCGISFRAVAGNVGRQNSAGRTAQADGSRRRSGFMRRKRARALPVSGLKRSRKPRSEKGPGLFCGGGAANYFRLKTRRTVSTACMVYSGLAASWKRSFMKDMGS